MDYKWQILNGFKLQLILTNYKPKFFYITEQKRKHSSKAEGGTMCF